MCQSTIVLQLLKPKSIYPMSCQFLVVAGSVTVFWSESLHLSKFLVMTDTQGQCSRSDLIALVKIGSLSKSLCFYEAVQERALIQNTQIHFDTGNNTCVFWVASVVD